MTRKRREYYWYALAVTLLMGLVELNRLHRGTILSVVSFVWLLVVAFWTVQLVMRFIDWQRRNGSGA